MYDHMLLAMAEAVSEKCGTRLDAAMNALIDYWQDKIAHVWQVADVIEVAEREGKPILRKDAIELLKTVFDQHDSSLGITRQTLEIAIQGYHLSFEKLSYEKYSDVHGVFKVSREHCPFAHQFGLFPKKVEGNFLAALDFARAAALVHPGQKVFIGCESSLDEDTRPWLILRFENDQVVISESKE